MELFFFANLQKEGLKEPPNKIQDLVLQYLIEICLKKLEAVAGYPWGYCKAGIAHWLWLRLFT